MLTRPSAESFPGARPKCFEHLRHQGGAVGHAVGDIVGKQHAILPARLVEEMRVELRHAVDMRRRDVQRARHG